MMKKRTYIWSGVLLVALLLVSTVLTGCSKSAESVAPVPNAALSPVVASSAPGSAPQEGIKVHGHWTIEVRNPDGSIAERREFENAVYQPNGSQALTSFLSRQASVGGWGISMWSSTINDDAFVPGSGCIIGEPAWPYNAENYFKNLTISTRHDVSDTEDVYRLILSGSATALRDGKIDRVETIVALLRASEPPSESYATPFGISPVTMKLLVSAVNLSAGQQVLVTVVISFS
jgi:hypothetical protein